MSTKPREQLEVSPCTGTQNLLRENLSLKKYSNVITYENAQLKETLRRQKGSWLPDGYSQIFRSYVIGPFGLLDYGSGTLRCKI